MKVTIEWSLDTYIVAARAADPTRPPTDASQSMGEDPDRSRVLPDGGEKTDGDDDDTQGEGEDVLDVGKRPAFASPPRERFEPQFVSPPRGGRPGGGVKRPQVDPAPMVQGAW